MSKIALMGSLAAALLVSGCVASGPSLMPGWFVMLDSPEEEEQQECTTDCTKTADETDDAEQESAEGSGSQSEQAR